MLDIYWIPVAALIVGAFVFTYNLGKTVGKEEVKMDRLKKVSRCVCGAWKYEGHACTTCAKIKGSSK